MASKPPQARSKAWKRLFLTASEGTKPADASISDLQPPDCETINFCCLSHPVRDTLFRQHWETNILSYREVKSQTKEPPISTRVPQPPLSIQGPSSEDFESKQQCPLTRITGCLYTRLPHTHTPEEKPAHPEVKASKHVVAKGAKGLRHLRVDRSSDPQL